MKTWMCFWLVISLTVVVCYGDEPFDVLARFGKDAVTAKPVKTGPQELPQAELTNPQSDHNKVDTSSLHTESSGSVLLNKSETKNTDRKENVFESQHGELDAAAGRNVGSESDSTFFGTQSPTAGVKDSVAKDTQRVIADPNHKTYSEVQNRGGDKSGLGVLSQLQNLTNGNKDIAASPAQIESNNPQFDSPAYDEKDTPSHSSEFFNNEISETKDAMGRENLFKTLDSWQDADAHNRVDSEGKNSPEVTPDPAGPSHNTDKDTQEAMNKAEVGVLSIFAKHNADLEDRIEHTMMNHHMMKDDKIEHTMMNHHMIKEDAGEEKSAAVNLELEDDIDGQGRLKDDELSDEGDPDYVEIAQPSHPYKQEETNENSEAAGLQDVNRDTYYADDEDLTGRDEEDRPYGNPSFMSESDSLDLAKKIPTDLSPEEREKLRQNISNALGLTALGPGLAVLPQDQSSDAAVSQPGNNKMLKPAKVIETIVSNASNKSHSLGPAADRNQQDGDADVDGNEVVADESREGLHHDGDGDEYDDYRTEDDGNDYRKKDRDYEFDYEGDDGEHYLGGDVHLNFSSSSNVGGGNRASLTPSPSVVEDGNRGSSHSEADEMGGEPSEKEGAAGVNDLPTSTQKDEAFDYIEDDDWYYNSDKASNQDEHTPGSQVTEKPFGNVGDGKQQGSYSQITAPNFKEGIISVEDVHTKKALQAPKGTIVLYTALIVIVISGIVIFSIWKNPFKKNGRPLHATGQVKNTEEWKRLLDHPFV